MGIKAEAATVMGADRKPEAPTGRQYASGLGVVAVVLAVVIGTPAWLLAAARTCACAQPPDISVYNLDTRPVTVTWLQPGILGTPLLARSDGARIEACSGYSGVLPVGRVALTIDSSTATGRFDLDVPQQFPSGPIWWFAVRDGGTVDRIPGPLPDAEVPIDGRCRS